MEHGNSSPLRYNGFAEIHSGYGKQHPQAIVDPDLVYLGHRSAMVILRIADEKKG
jgi:hypothetical protein